MSKEVAWGTTHGEGDIVCTCDNCGSEVELPFEDGNVDYRAAQQYIKDDGWESCQVHGEWYDFCCEKCRNEYIKNNG